MELHRNRSLLFTVACLLGATAAATACAADVESVSSGGTASANAGVEQSPPSSVPGSITAPPHSPPPTVTPAEGAPVVPAGIPETTIPDPNTSLPAPTPTEPPTIPAAGQDPSFLDCGIIYRASGWPTTFVPNPESFACLQDAFDAGTPARLVDRAQTDGEGGAILVTTYDVLGSGLVRVTVDAREAADRPQGVTISQCTGLVSEFTTVTTSGCTVIG